jgi:EAL and modified HD-GYP domain-containing signal transduction protein
MRTLEPTCLARQPIFTRTLEVCGYELLYRSNPDAESSGLVRPTSHQETAASAATLTTALTDIGLDAIVGDRPAWVNVGHAFLLGDLAQALPPDRVVLEVLESVPATSEVVEALESLKADGYRLALDDFVAQPLVGPLVEVADIVKIDVLALDWDRVEEQVAVLKPYGVSLLAEKVETHDVLERCRDLDFDLFQGHFLSRPRLVTDTRVSAEATVRIQLAARLNDPDVGFDELARLIESDVTLGYRLLRYVNSAYVGLPKPVGTMREALLLVGLRRMRSWATLLLLTDAGAGRQELAVTALVRARMCELLAAFTNENAGEGFLVGLLSVVDALLDRPLSAAVEDLPIAGHVRGALLARAGRLGDLLERVLAYERTNFDRAVARPLDEAAVSAAYVAATEWASLLVRGLGD